MTEEINPRIPVATYRLQLNRTLGFRDAREIVGYLKDLGISDIYTSPYLGAKKGSLHGYDIVDHNILNPEIGTQDEFDAFMAELKNSGMGQVLDIVPNHMGIGSENAWWMDLLENGPSSVYAAFFDVDWEPVKKELKDKVLLPVLGSQYGTTLENQEIALSFHNGAFYINYYEHKFPVRPQTYTRILRHRIEILEKSMGEGNPHLTEYLSIITAIEHLPFYTEQDAEKIRERYREKEIVKKRLWDLSRDSHEIMEFINSSVGAFNGVKGDTRSFDLLDSLISDQVYRLSYWRVATEEINYRRFFDINELAAIRVEDPDVFAKTHELLLRLIREGKATGLRVDHPDGLYNPEEYFKNLQRACFIQKAMAERELSPQDAERAYEELLANNPEYKPFYIVGEKILIKGERMPEDWPIFSTTGYVFLNSVNGIFIDTSNAKAFEDIYIRFIREKFNYIDITYGKKKQVMYTAMASEINMLAHYLNLISEKNRHTRDFTLNSLRMVIIEVIAFFQVYRTYVKSSGANDRDTKYIESAVSKAIRKNPDISESVFHFLKDVLVLNYPDYLGQEDRAKWLDFAMRFQQITGPVMAKGVEDTSFYVYNRFLSLNEVGGSPDRFGTLLETFHGQNIERSKYWPYAMISTATHDTKRGEDVRARLNVLSEMPDEWKRRLASWSKINSKKKVVLEKQRLPERNDEYLLYQILIGAWPVHQMDRAEYDTFKARIREYILKAVREAKVNSSWISPDSVYEEAFMTFAERLMEPYPDNPFLNDFLPFQKKISHYGMFNALSQALLKMTSPGIPDFYQGTELWDFSLVDPDNRRPVDYQKRRAILEEIKRRESETGLIELAKDLLINKEDGRIKMYLIYRAMNYRTANRELFETGEYLPLDITGLLKDNVCAFARRKADKTIIVAVTRFHTRIFPAEAPPVGTEVWHDTYIVLPFEGKHMTYRSVFTDETAEAVSQDGNRLLRVSDILGTFPAALLEDVIL